MKALSLALVLLIAIASSTPIPYTSCDKSPPELVISTADATPWPPALGQPITIIVAGTLQNTITGGTYTASVSFDGIPILSKSGALSTIVPLPINAGPFSLNRTITIPSIPISGSISASIQLTDSNGADIICLSITIPIGRIHNFNYINGDSLVTSPEIIKTINEHQKYWKAGENSKFSRMTVSKAKKLMGVKKDPNFSFKPLGNIYDQNFIDSLPTEYDPRTFNKKTAKCTGPVLDQAECGSCWAFGAAEAISDRLCLKTGNFVQLAPLDLVTCDENDGGCEGGDPGSAWQYAQDTGLVTESCYPYLQSEGGPMPTCAPADEPCLSFVDTPQCNETCNNNSTFAKDKHFISSFYNVVGVSQIAAEITAHGPVEADFIVYSDFVNYKSGVYVQTSSDELGGHAIKIVGYGTENGVDYWLCQNSWTTTWGDQGYFKIRKGTNECGIEDDIIGGTM